METTTKTRREELEERIEALRAQEEAQHQELVRLAAEVGQVAARYDDAQAAARYRTSRTTQPIKEKRNTHVERLRAEAALAALEIEEVDDVLPDRRAVVDQLLEQRKKLDAQLAEAQRPLHDLEGRRHSLQLDYWRLTHEADAFESGSEAM